jgi:hypothetical protein
LGSGGGATETGVYEVYKVRAQLGDEVAVIFGLCAMKRERPRTVIMACCFATEYDDRAIINFSNQADRFSLCSVQGFLKPLFTQDVACDSASLFRVVVQAVGPSPGRLRVLQTEDLGPIFLVAIRPAARPKEGDGADREVARLHRVFQEMGNLTPK